jgi:CDP-glucose 4,6-dehydratase
VNLNTFAGANVFLTGDTGFKGSWLALWLHQMGARVTGFALPPDHSEAHFCVSKIPGRICHIDGDVRDAEHLTKAMQSAEPRFVFHLAAQPLVRRSYLDPKTTFDTNFGGSVNLLEAVRATPSVRVLVYVTSDKCYRDLPSPAGYREEDVLGGKDPYSASKACAELLFASYQASFFAHRANFAAASVRAGNVIGGGDWSEDRIVPDCIRALRGGEPIQVRNPRAVRPWQHVLEALYGYLTLAALLDQHGRDFEGAWNFGPDSESHQNVRELVEATIRNWGGGSYVESGAAESMTETVLLCLDSSKARQKLGWKPKWNFERTIHETVSWYRQYVSGADVWELSTAAIARYTSHD